MDELERALRAVLDDPAQLQELRELAGSMGFSVPQAQPERAPVPDPPESEPKPVQAVFQQQPLPEPAAAMLRQAGKMDRRQEALLLALKLLGRELGELRIYDPNAAQCRRYELELNQVLPLDHPLPPVTVCTEDTLFDCDLLLFTASRGVPPVGSGVADVRLAQYEKNRAMLRSYAAMARKTHFTGLFCQISDPVDPLACAVFRESNRNAAGEFDGCGLLPEQVQGFGLGVMEARARWCAQEDGIDFSNGRVYGPHGGGLGAANDPAAYDKSVSARLTERAVHANLEVRALGFKPYLAPALSSAAVSILSLVRGQPYDAALPLGGVWLGAQRRMTPLGPLQRREPLHPALLARIEAARLELEAFCHDA